MPIKTPLHKANAEELEDLDFWKCFCKVAASTSRTPVSLYLSSRLENQKAGLATGSYWCGKQWDTINTVLSWRYGMTFDGED